MTKNEQTQSHGPSFWLWMVGCLAVGATVGSVAATLATEAATRVIVPDLAPAPGALTIEPAPPSDSWTEAQREAIAQLLTNVDRETLSLAVVGNKATGKTALISQLEKSWQAEQPKVTAITEIEGEEVSSFPERDGVSRAHNIT